MTKTELIRQIRFGIEQLKATNSTLDFEHICRFFARARIARNVIPATGPVQSYGDQGRDFETFHSYLASTDINESCSLAFASKPIAFPCSLEKNPLKKKGKIDSDLTTILNSGTAVERIYFFSGEDISVGSRHKKQQEVKDQFGIDLEIIDAQALSEHLSDPDLFWIATRYLNIPNDFFPRQTEENWYDTLLSEYKTRELCFTYEEFNDIKSAIRHIYKDEILKVELSFWLNKIEGFLSPHIPRDLQRKAIYEKFIARLIGQNNIDDLENNIRDYYRDVEDDISPAALDDAQILLTYVQNSKRVIGSLISQEDINSFIEKISTVIEKELKDNISGSKRCSYMEIQANMLLQDLSKAAQGDLLNTSGYISKLEDILPKLDNAPFYPLERLAFRILDYLGLFLELGGETRQLENFIKKLDVHLGKRKSELSIGDAIRDRALLYMKAGKVTIAINLLHQLKIKWFANEATKGVILTAMLLADCYSKLEMEYASKYYSLIAADMSMAYGNDADIKILFPQAMKKAADSAYITGSWFHYFDLLFLTLSSFHLIKKDFNIYEDEETASIVYYPALIKFIAKKFELSVSFEIDQKIRGWKYIGDEINEVYEQIKVEKDLYSVEKIQQNLSEQLLGLPFNDIGKNRTITFNIYGSYWSIEFENDFSTNAVAEQFVSMLQIFLVEFSDSDLFLTKGVIRIKLSIAKDPKVFYQQEASNTENIWSIEIPDYQGGDIDLLTRHQLNYTALIASILRSISLIPDLQMKEIIAEKLSAGLLNAVTFGQTYKTLYESYFSKEEFNTSQRSDFTREAITANFVLKTNEKLFWRSDISSTYSNSKNLEVIHRRINHKLPFEMTLNKMMSNPTFMEIIKQLRQDWQDWHIYLAFGNLILRYKLEQMNIQETDIEASEEYSKIFLKYSAKSESEWYMDIPVSTFSIEKMQRYLNSLHIITVLPSYGLEFHSNTPDFSAIKELLAKRFNFLEDGRELIVF